MIYVILLCIWLVLRFTNRIESFMDACLNYPNYIRSIDVEIILNESVSVYEYPISTFREMVKPIKTKNPKEFLKKLNNLPQIKESKSFYEIIYEYDNEMLIYRLGKYYGFHIKLDKKPIVKGIVNDYDILSRYTKRKLESLKDVYLRLESDPILSSYYSGISSSSDN